MKINSSEDLIASQHQKMKIINFIREPFVRPYYKRPVSFREFSKIVSFTAPKTN